MAALRQTGSHCGGPRAGQVLPETQIPPKQSPSCLPVTGRGILRALPGKGLGPGHKGSIFPGKQREAGCRQLPEEPVPITHGHRGAGVRCLLPPVLCHAGGSRTLAWPLLEVAGWMRPLLLQDHPQELSRSGVCLHDVAQTPARLAPPGQSLSAGRAVPGALLEEPGSIPCHPALAGTSTAGDTAFPARGIPHRAEPGFWARDVAPVGADALCWCPFPSRPALCTSPSVPASAWALFPQSFHG